MSSRIKNTVEFSLITACFDGFGKLNFLHKKTDILATLCGMLATYYTRPFVSFLGCFCLNGF